ncbi:MAG: hypothetical protein QGH23_03900 [Dehalococcoidia bacterium]|jgi:hypothetical protein|nr:hypothetical protein [Dehalococcoidia bacterium]MDP6782390.1 hypothetical protein [Dehalococcoidia bacterium]
MGLMDFMMDRWMKGQSSEQRQEMLGFCRSMPGEMEQRFLAQ